MYKKPRFLYLSALMRLAVLVSLPSSTLAADSPSAETFRVVHLHVLQANGQPAVHRDVELRGLDRAAWGPLLSVYDDSTASRDLEKARSAGWLFTTDEQGEIVARIGNFVGWKDPEQRPGFGTYTFVVQPGADNAGGVSQRFTTWNLSDPNRFYLSPSDWGQPLPLPSGRLDLTMALQTGYTLYGQLLDDRDHRTPVPNVSIATWNDLHVDTHTGYGGEIFPHGAVTDANGEFKLEHLYFSPLYLRIGALWMTTDQGDKWVTQEEDVLSTPIDHDARVTLGVITHPDFHYTGLVHDAEGKPVVNADVVVGISSQPQADSWEDTHHFERTKTDAQGHYDLAASSPWGTFLEAEDPTHGRVDLKWTGYDSPPIPPGKYDLAFPAKPNPPK